MKFLKYILGLLIVGSLTGCFDDDFDFDYNPNAAAPVVQNLNGPTGATSNGFGENVYTIAPRGGATVNWSVTGTEATVTAEGPKATIIYAEKGTPGTAYVIVTESINGKTSQADSVIVALSAYCAMDASAFIGTATLMGDECDRTNNEPIVAGTGAGDLLMSGIMNATVTDSWGEVWDVGVGNGGVTQLTMNADGSLVIAEQHLGDTDGGSWRYYIRGSGSYDQCNETMSIDFDFGDGPGSYWGGSYSCTVTIEM
jgi:hypothetical protein